MVEFCQSVLAGTSLIMQNEVVFEEKNEWFLKVAKLERTYRFLIPACDISLSVFTAFCLKEKKLEHFYVRI